LFAEPARAILVMGKFDFVIGSACDVEGMQAGWKPAFFEQPLRPTYSGTNTLGKPVTDKG